MPMMKIWTGIVKAAGAAFIVTASVIFCFGGICTEAQAAVAVSSVAVAPAVSSVAAATASVLPAAAPVVMTSEMAPAASSAGKASESGTEPDIISDSDYEQIQQIINETSVSYTVSFSDIVAQLLAGNMSMTFESIGKYVYEHIFMEVGANKTALLQIIGIAIIGAVFTNFSVAFAKNYVAETGFYMTYIILFSLLLTSFLAAFNIASSVLEFLVGFMGALLPAFCTALAFASGTSSAAGFYSVMVIAVSVVDWLICRVLLKFIQVYMVLSLVNHISRENYLSKLGELLRTIISWSMKTILGLTLGLNIIQGMILPAFDSFKGSVVMKVSSVIPGVGNALNAAARTAIGSGVLIKNAIGVGGLIVILILCALPLLKLIIISLMYKVAEAVIQPVSDERIVECIHITADSVVLLLMAVGTAILLFILSLAVIASASNFGIN